MQMTVREEDVCVIRMIKLLTADEEGELSDDGGGDDDEDDKKQRTSPFAEFNWFPSLSLRAALLVRALSSFLGRAAARGGWFIISRIVIYSHSQSCKSPLPWTF